MQRILFITASAPFPTNDGKRQRTYALLAALATRWQVDCLVVGDRTGYESAASNNNPQGVRYLFATLPSGGLYHRMLLRVGWPSTERSIKAHLGDLINRGGYRMIFTRYALPLAWLPKDGLPPVACDLDDDPVEVLRTRAAQLPVGFSWLLFSLRAAFTEWQLKQVLSKVSLLFIPRPGLHPRGRLLPNLPFQALDGAPVFHAAPVPMVLFAGKLTYPPNAEGLRWFLLEVWPQLCRRMPGIRMTVVSSVQPADRQLVQLLEQASGLVSVTAVGDVATVYHGAAVAIAPVFHGSGSSIKVAEALVFGRPVVATPFGARGYDAAVDRGYVRVAETPDRFAEAVETWLSSKQLAAVQQEVFDWSRENFNLSAWQADFLKEINYHLSTAG